VKLIIPWLGLLAAVQGACELPNEQVELASTRLAGTPCAGQQVPRGGRVDVAGNVYDSDGTLVAPFTPCAPADGTTTSAALTSVSQGYQAYIYSRVAGTVFTFNRIDSTFTVPPLPAVSGGAHAQIYTLFPALQAIDPATSTPTLILQTVLLWGGGWQTDPDPNPDWDQYRIQAVACCVGGTVYFSPQWTVHAGDTIYSQVTMSAWNVAREQWIISISSGADAARSSG